MEITVSGKNEFVFYPSIGGNLEQPEADRFAIVYRKLLNSFHADSWTRYTAEGEFKIDMLKKVATHIIRLENAPFLILPNGQKERLSKKALCANEYPELFPVLEELVTEIQKTSDEDEQIETKKQ